MLLLEIKHNMIYLTTDKREEITEAIEFLQREFETMATKGTMQRTIYDFRTYRKRDVIRKPA